MAKRGNAEGSIYKRKDGRWAGAFLLPNGRRKAVYAKTRAEAGTKLRESQHLVARGMVLADERTTVETFLNTWLQTIQSTVRPRTYQGYALNVERHLTPDLGHIRLARLTPETIQLLLAKKLAQGLAPQTVRNIHATLRAALRQAERWSVLARNPASLVSPPRVAREELQPRSVEQAQAFLQAVREDRLSALYYVAMLGLRQGEILGLRWEDLDFAVNTLRVQRTLQRYGGEYHLTEPKTTRSRRTVPLPLPVVDALRAHRTKQYEERLRAGTMWQGEQWGLVFCREDGAPLSGAVVTHRFQSTLKQAGLPRQPFHRLRHSAASIMLAQGVPLRTVMEVLGHSEIGTTANIYGHLTGELTRDATERVGRAIWGAS